ncbi:MAG: hypothetical protein J7647_25410 [Cyanobacteria bacterium SBLK]|nr:hypothetical protein [Cyanobacteria bacterium SBLK]
MRATWMVLLAIAMGLILLQNWEPSLSLILFGTETIVLPLAVWLGLGVLAGLGTSLAVQLLERALIVPPRKTNPEVAPRYRETTRQKRRTRPPGKSDWEVSPSADWDPLPEDDGGWEIDEPPAETTVPQTNFPESELRKNARNPRRNASPKERPPQRDSQKKQDSPESTATSTQSSESIYDANYRVITPPNTEESKPSSESNENWEF